MSRTKFLLNEYQASEMTGLKPATLRKRRWQGEPPCFLKVGSRVFYDRDYLEQFLEGCVRFSTSDRGRG